MISLDWAKMRKDRVKLIENYQKKNQAHYGVIAHWKQEVESKVKYNRQI